MTLVELAAVASAGLRAALVLGRARRRVAVVVAGVPRVRVSDSSGFSARAGQFRRLSSPALLERANAVIRQGRGRIVEVEPWHPLTTREFEVARLVSDGHTNAEIAEALGIAPKTASAHIEHILAKLGASRRAEIAAWTSQIATVAGSR